MLINNTEYMHVAPRIQAGGVKTGALLLEFQFALVKVEGVLVRDIRAAEAWAGSGHRWLSIYGCCFRPGSVEIHLLSVPLGAPEHGHVVRLTECLFRSPDAKEHALVYACFWNVKELDGIHNIMYNTENYVTSIIFLIKELLLFFCFIKPSDETLTEGYSIYTLAEKSVMSKNFSHAFNKTVSSFCSDASRWRLQPPAYLNPSHVFTTQYWHASLFDWGNSLHMTK